MMPDFLCVPCVAQLHDFCDSPTEGENNVDQTCCCWTSTGTDNGGGYYAADSDSDRPQTLGQILAHAINGEGTSRPRVRAEKSGEALKDVLSTGRKRAALAKPIHPGSVCEWASLKYAGGGVYPIVGCAGNVLVEERGKYARHHGPDKNVLNNESTNLHLICVTCHNRWHTLNDPFYGDGTGSSRPPEGQTWLPNTEWKMHDPDTQATSEDIINNENYWATKKVNRAKNG